ncbi:MAG: 3-hydroxyacyl-CoA dehydrogenase NAD-binding domain-containing protein [Pseudomonadota bacterium]
MTESISARHLELAEQQATQLATEMSANAAEITSVAVVGGGTMGRGIAITLLDAGLAVTLLEVDSDGVDMARESLTAYYQSRVSRGPLSDDDAQARLSALHFTTTYAHLAEADLVIEAVFEDLDIKREVFKQLDAACKSSTILASNTSYQDINLLAEVTERPRNVIGMHFFSPANVMKLLEIVQGEATSPSTLTTVIALAQRCGKISVVSGVCYGFIGNRINRRLQQQAQLCLLEGATPLEIDQAMEQFGMAMGPLAVGDLAGLDIGYRARKALSAAQRGDPRTYRIPDQLVEDGRLGQKSGLGYYRYESGTRSRQEDPKVIQLIASASEEFGYTRRTLTADEIVERLLLAVVNEAASVLSEGIARRASDIDLVYVYGYGFPKSEGGIMFWANRLGLDLVHAKLLKYWQLSGDTQLEPVKLVLDLASSGRRF